MNRLALFDCDGTLVDSQHNICAAVDEVFTNFNLPLPDHHQVRRGVGLHVRDAMERLAPTDSDADLIDQLTQEYKSSFSRLTQQDDYRAGYLYDGILDILDTLEADGWLLGVATGNSDRGLARILTHHGLNGRFVTLQTADHHPSKPHPSMALTALSDAGADASMSMMIGDTSYDMGMGKAAGMTCVGVDWGYHDIAELRGAGADHIVMKAIQIRSIYA